MDLGTIFAILVLGMLIFLPFVFIFHPRVKNKLKVDDSDNISKDDNKDFSD